MPRQLLPLLKSHCQLFQEHFPTVCLTFTSKLLSLYLQLHIYTRVHYSPHARIVRIILHFEHLTVHALHYMIKRTSGIFDPPMQVMIKLCNVMVHSMGDGAFNGAYGDCN